MITSASEKSEILKALRKQVAALEADLTPTGLADSRLKIEWRAAKSADRTAATFETWLKERATQVAVAWVLGTVFVRFCEDNGLIEYPFIAGPGSRLQLAQDLQQDFFAKSPELTDRDWLIAAFDSLSVSPVAAALFDRRHNPMWTISPSHDAAKGLLAFWRQTGPDGEVVYDFTDETWNTRFLGDLYQDLSEAARKTYALLQTPEFVEEFILKYTLDPAIEEFGLTP
ncbi:MAG TPA: SAM-dependent methyltransferase, partial [Trebonia sp.]|nr:SAM-dependent methyltransferase [Trebonia sp.]